MPTSRCSEAAWPGRAATCDDNTRKLHPARALYLGETQRPCAPFVFALGFGAELFARTETEEIHMAETFAGAKRKIIGGAAALAVAVGTVVVMAQPAAARPWHHHWHHR